MNPSRSYSQETLYSGQNWRFFVPRDLEIWRMPFKSIETPLLSYFRFVHHHMAISQSKQELLSGTPLRVTIGDFLSRGTLKFDGWTWKAVGHLFHATCTSSCEHHFIASAEFKVELQCRNSKFGWKSAIYFPRDLGIWRVTLTTNRAQLFYQFKLYVSFRSQLWIQTVVTVPKRWNRGKICIDLCNLDLSPLTLIFCMDINSVNDNNFWKFNNDRMMDTK